MTAAVESFRAAPQAPLRERIVAAAIHLTSTFGWTAVTMSQLAGLTGVSRQTVYNEIGTKPDLADAMVQSELARFLAAMTGAFDAHPGDVVAALRAAVERVLELAQDNPLIQAVASATHGADTELLPLLTTRSAELLATAGAAVDGLLRPRRPRLPERQRADVVDVVVRTVLSHVMQPGRTPAETAEAVAWIAGAALGPERPGQGGTRRSRP